VKTTSHAAAGSYRDLMASLTEQLQSWIADPDWDQPTTDRYNEGISLLAKLMNIDDEGARTLVVQQLHWSTTT
jgi:hypothetical protein